MGMFGEIASEGSSDSIARTIEKLWRKETNPNAKEAYRQALKACGEGYDWDYSNYYKKLLKELG